MLPRIVLLPERSPRLAPSPRPASRRLARTGALALVAALAGCDDPTLALDTGGAGTPLTAVSVPACQGPARSLAPTLAAQLRDDAFRSPDAQFADLARRVPGGFAGVYYDTPAAASGGPRPGNGRPVLLLTDPSQAAAARAALAPALPHFDVAGAEVRPARWTFAQLYDWYRYLGQQAGIWTGSGLTMSDINEVRNRIELGVETEEARSALTRRLSTMGLPCDLIHVLIVPPATFRPGV